MDPRGLLLAAIAFAPCALLLWLAATVQAAVAGRTSTATRAVSASAALLAAGALWWPAHLVTSEEATLALAAGWVLSVALVAASAAGTLTAMQRRLLPPVGFAMLTMLLGYIQAMLMLPGLFRLSATGGIFSGGALTLTLTAALFAAQFGAAGARFARSLRVGGALLAAMVMSLATVASAPLPIPALPGSIWTEFVMLLGVAGVAAALRLVVLSSDSGGEAPVRLVRAQAFDQLTGLPTRLDFESRLANASRKCDAKGGQLAVLFVDLDGFKPVNDNYGHSTGDRVLEQVGRRLRAASRGADLTARVGGDEFLLLVSNVTSRDTIAQVATRLIEALSQTYEVDGREATISASVGIAMYPDNCEPGKLIARADAAMYSAKRAGGGRHCFYSPEMDANAQENFELGRDLRQALARNEFELHYQPKIDARSGKVTAAEALLRWRHPTRGMIPPGQFIPLAERTGQIGAIGDWVIEAACQQARQWRENGLRMRVAINLSTYQMRQDDIVDRIAQALQRYRIHPSLLTCEITESAAMEDTRATQETFRRLGELGAHLSIDDFGTGYSSLAYLRQLPAEELKIDRSFIQDLERSADARAVVDAVVKLAHALGLKVVAEGVENQRQRRILVDLGCDELQGFMFAQPMTPRALLLWAIGDRSESAQFRESLFGETREATLPGT